MISLNVARTDISDQVMVTLEAVLPERDPLPFIERLKKMIEVYAVQMYVSNLKRTRFYRLASGALNNELWLLVGSMVPI